VRPDELRFDLSGIGLRVSGLTAEQADALHAEWSGFRVETLREAFLDLAVEVGGEPVRGETPFAGTFEGSFDASRALYRIPEGEVRVDAQGAATLRLAPAAPNVQLYALINLASAAVGWRLPARDGAALHAAGLVHRGRAFLLVGPSGSGKSTWAGLGKAAGARLLSEDTVFVDGAGAGAQALSMPFRHDRENPPTPGRWPLGGILFPSWGSAARIEPASPLRARASLTANFLFVAKDLDSDPRPSRVIDRLLSQVPCRTLVFARDASFLELLESLLPGRP